MKQIRSEITSWRKMMEKEKERKSRELSDVLQSDDYVKMNSSR